MEYLIREPAPRNSQGLDQLPRHGRAHLKPNWFVGSVGRALRLKALEEKSQLLMASGVKNVSYSFDVYLANCCLEI